MFLIERWVCRDHYVPLLQSVPCLFTGLGNKVDYGPKGTVCHGQELKELMHVHHILVELQSHPLIRIGVA